MKPEQDLIASKENSDKKSLCYGLVDVDQTLLFGLEGDTQLNQNVILDLKMRGITEIYLFTSMSVRDIPERTKLIEDLAQKGLTVKAVISPLDVRPALAQVELTKNLLCLVDQYYDELKKLEQMPIDDRKKKFEKLLEDNIENLNDRIALKNFVFLEDMSLFLNPGEGFKINAENTFTVNEKINELSYDNTWSVCVFLITAMSDPTFNNSKDIMARLFLASKFFDPACSYYFYDDKKLYLNSVKRAFFDKAYPFNLLCLWVKNKVDKPEPCFRFDNSIDESTFLPEDQLHFDPAIKKILTEPTFSSEDKLNKIILLARFAVFLGQSGQHAYAMNLFRACSYLYILSELEEPIVLNQLWQDFCFAKEQSEKYQPEKSSYFSLSRFLTEDLIFTQDSQDLSTETKYAKLSREADVLICAYELAKLMNDFLSTENPIKTFFTFYKKPSYRESLATGDSVKKELIITQFLNDSNLPVKRKLEQLKTTIAKLTEKALEANKAVILDDIRQKINNIFNNKNFLLPVEIVQAVESKLFTDQPIIISEISDSSNSKKF
jgi:hypothetical protein